MSRSTPGPWRHYHNTASTLDVPCIEIVSVEHDTYSIAYLQGFIDSDPRWHRTRERTVADAHLIAEAPVLFRLLEEARDIIADHLPAYEVWLNASADAIARVEGQS